MQLASPNRPGQAARSGCRLPWYHPRRLRHAIARRAEDLPAEAHDRHLTGAVLRAPECAASLAAPAARRRPCGRRGACRPRCARKGILLAGGTGSRLYPITMGVSKQLLPVYDKPMIFYPLSVLMLAGIREIAVITTPEDQDQFRRLMGDGSQWGLRLTWIAQPRPEGLAQAYLLAEDFLAGAASAMVLGDNIFFGHGLTGLLRATDARTEGATVFGYQVADPERYGVVDFLPDGTVRSIVEKPARPASSYAVTGLYFLDGTAPAKAARVTPSARGELEITSLLEMYLAEGSLRVSRMGRGYAWLDTGTHASLLDAGNFVRTLETRQGLQVGSPDEIAFTQGWIDRDALAARAALFAKTDYGKNLIRLLAPPK